MKDRGKKTLVTLCLTQRQSDYLISHYCNMFSDDDWNSYGELKDTELQDLLAQLLQAEKDVLEGEA